MDSSAIKTPTLQEKPLDETPAGEIHQDDNDKAVEDCSLSGAKLHILIVGLALAVFLMALDMSIITTAIPLITEKFQATEDIGWYFSAYSLSL